MKSFIAVLWVLFVAVASLGQEQGGDVSLITVRVDGGTNDGVVTLTNIVVGSTTQLFLTSGDLSVSPSGQVSIYDQPGIRVVMEEVFTNYASTTASLAETLTIKFNRGTNTEFTLERSSSLSEPTWNTFSDGEIVSVMAELGPSSHVDYIVWHINLRAVGVNTVFRVRATSPGPTNSSDVDPGGTDTRITLDPTLPVGWDD